MNVGRPHQFKSSQYYRLKKTIKTATDIFTQGEEVQFIETTYSRYDNSTAFIFRTRGGETKTWFLNDTVPDDSGSIFELI